MPDTVDAVSIDQLKRRLNKRSISKNLSVTDAIRIKIDIGDATTTWRCLVFVNDILLDNLDIEQSYQRNKDKVGEPARQKDPREPDYMDLSFEFTSLSDPDSFRSFRRLLFYTKTHFDFSFDSGKWVQDTRGLYARDNALRADLVHLNSMHNRIYDALIQFRNGQRDRGQALVDDTFQHHRSVVDNHHHRQFSDIIAILLLVKRNGLDHIIESITMSLSSEARRHLQLDDPRRVMFDSLIGLPRESTGHLYLAFDAYCRRLWKSRTGPDNAKASYSWNQGSFPRAEAGEFFEFFKGKEVDATSRILKEIDKELGEYSHETFMIWHTAIRCLQNEQRCRDMEDLARSLCKRVFHLHCLGDEFDWREARQLNLDSMLSFYLLGCAVQEQGNLISAELAFKNSVELRTQIVPTDNWCPGRAGALRRLTSIAKSLRENSADIESYRFMEAKMYPGL